MALVELEGLTIHVGETTVVDGLALELEPAKVTALIGESGSGKSVTALALCGVLPPSLRASWSRLTVAGRAVAGLDELAALRGRTIALMPQEAGVALDPVMRVGEQLDEVLVHVAGVSQRELDARRTGLLTDVGFSDPLVVARSFPHQLSGGMRQRASLAASLSARPQVLIVDEPTTALDGPLARSVLALIKQLAVRHQLAVLLITHDLAAAEAIADDGLVLYAGRPCEKGVAGRLFGAPRHPYTHGLSMARLDRPRPVPLPGAQPALEARPAGCRFKPRCGRATAACDGQPPFVDEVACHHPLEAR